MIVSELLLKARDTLQDQEKIFWDDSELLGYYEEARRVIASERRDKRLTQSILLNDGNEYYAPVGVLRYVSVKDDNGTDRPLYPNDGSGDNDPLGIVVIDYDQIQVIDDTNGASLAITYIGLPLNHNLNDDVRQGDEEAVRYYILSKSYEKETDMENFAKASQFMLTFNDRLKKLVGNATMGYQKNSLNTIKSYYY